MVSLSPLMCAFDAFNWPGNPESERNCFVLAPRESADQTLRERTAETTIPPGQVRMPVQKPPDLWTANVWLYPSAFAASCD